MLDFSPINISIWSRLGSCGAFGLAAMELPKVEEKSVMVTSDLCTFSGLDRFKKSFPDHLYNVGIAEQNMIGVAAGLAKEGFVPFATTYASFASTRCADQVKVNMGYMGLGVKLVGLTSGYAVGILGPTHMGLEDLAFFRSIPGVTILSPADCTSTVKATLAAAKIKGPVYLRLSGPMGAPAVYKNDFEFEVGKAITLREGADVSIIATGTMVARALKTADLLAADGISARVIDMHTIAPLDVQAVKEACAAKLFVTMEEHFVTGGLGGAVAECLAEVASKPRQLIFGVCGGYPHAGSYPYLMDEAGLTPEKMSVRIIETLKEK